MTDRRVEDRGIPSNDHDLLIKIDANLSNFMQRFDLHTKDDNDHLNRLYAKTARLEKFLYMAMGAIAVFEVLIRVIQ